MAALLAVVAFRSWVAAQARTVVVFSSAVEIPVITWAVEVVTDEPQLSEISVAGVPTTLARPDGQGAWPAVVFVNGVTRRGRRHPQVRGLAEGLARAGYLVLVPDLPGLRFGELTGRTVAGTIAVARAAASRPDVRGGRVALYGVSAGTSLALLAAERPELAGRISVVAGLAPYTDLANAIRLATTGYYRMDGRLIRYETEEFLDLVAARSLAAGLAPGRDRDLLLSRLRVVSDKDPAPLMVLRGSWTRRLRGDARAVVRLMLNRDPVRFERLYARLSMPVRMQVRRLSPIVEARRLRAPIEIATPPHDKYFPPAESHALARLAPDVRVTVTRTLDHAIPEPSVRDVGDLFRFDGFLLRALEKAR